LDTREIIYQAIRPCGVFPYQRGLVGTLAVYATGASKMVCLLLVFSPILYHSDFITGTLEISFVEK